jgi:hypothetical protein
MAVSSLEQDHCSRSLKAVKACSISARPKRTSPASVTRRPSPGLTGRRHACGTPLQSRPAPPSAGSAVLPETTVGAIPGTQPTAGVPGQVARQDAQPVPLAARPTGRRQQASAPLAAARAEPRLAPSVLFEELPYKLPPDLGVSCPRQAAAQFGQGHGVIARHGKPSTACPCHARAYGADPLSPRTAMLGAAALMLPFQDQSEWQIEWQNRACESLSGLASAGTGSCYGWSMSLACGNGTLRGFMVRRRSTVRFRKGALLQSSRSSPGFWSAQAPFKIL